MAKKVQELLVGWLHDYKLQITNSRNENLFSNIEFVILTFKMWYTIIISSRHGLIIYSCK